MKSKMKRKIIPCVLTLALMSLVLSSCKKNGKPQAEQPKEQKNAIDYYKSGKSKVKAADYPGAIADFTKAIELAPNKFAFFSSRGAVKDKTKDFLGAIQDYTRAIELNPKADRVYYGRGHAKQMLRDFQGAIEDYSKAIEFNKEFKEAYCNRGLLKVKLKQKMDGCSDLRKAAELGDNKAQKLLEKFCK